TKRLGEPLCPCVFVSLWRAFLFRALHACVASQFPHPMPEQKYNYDVLAIGAHPDDIEHSVGGTLLHLRRAGKKICMLHMTHGEAGTYGNRDTREDEARATAKFLGAEVRWM